MSRHPMVEQQFLPTRYKFALETGMRILELLTSSGMASISDMSYASPAKLLPL